MRFFKSKKRQLAEAQAETLKMISILIEQHLQLEAAFNEVVEALNRFGAVVGLEWNQQNSQCSYIPNSNY